ncbi:hypothetical protein AAG570_010880, partial [Ranatra chinensis]
DLQFPIDVNAVQKDHPFLDQDSLQSLFRRLQVLNRCATMKVDNLPKPTVSPLGRLPNIETTAFPLFLFFLFLLARLPLGFFLFFGRENHRPETGSPGVIIKVTGRGDANNKREILKGRT